MYVPHIQFKEELLGKEAKLDTDPGLWMPFSLSKDSYIKLLSAKVHFTPLHGMPLSSCRPTHLRLSTHTHQLLSLHAQKTPESESGPHYDRVRAMLDKFQAQVCMASFPYKWHERALSKSHCSLYVHV